MRGSVSTRLAKVAAARSDTPARAASVCVFLLGNLAGCSNTPALPPAKEEQIPSATHVYAERPFGWASVDDLGLEGTTGGEAGEVIEVTELEQLIAQALFPGPRVILIFGALGSLGEGSRVAVSSDKTLIGIGQRPTLYAALDIKDAHNVIIRNLSIQGAEPDGIGIRRSHHVWVDHVDISDSGDGNLDITEQSDYVTISWSKFWYSTTTQLHRFSNLIGAGDGAVADQGKLRITFHHAWWADNVQERMPRVRYGQVHVFNSLYTAVGNNHCVRAGVFSNILTENNAFIGVEEPFETATESNAESVLVSRGNLYIDTTGNTEDKGTDVFVPPYPYDLDAAEEVEALIRSDAGPCPRPGTVTPNATLSCGNPP